MLVSYTFVGVRKVNGVDHAVIAVKGSFPSTRIPVQLGNRGAGPGPGPGPGPGQFPGRPGGGGAEGSITMGGTARGTAIVDLSKNRVAKVNMVLDSKIDISVPAMKLDLGLHDRHEFKMTRESDDRR